MGYVAVARLRFGDSWIEPGEPVPVESHRRYDQMLFRGEIAEIPDGKKSSTRVSVKDEAAKLTRSELDDRAEEAGVSDPDGLPNKETVAEAIDTHDRLEVLSRKDLDQRARDVGVDAPERLGNKQDVVEAIRAAESDSASAGE